jgi:putative oxygen-independent coproporphyrinogen III oxidase
MPFSSTPDMLTGLPTVRFGLYLHFPYCAAQCPYCDFAVTVEPRGKIPKDRYTQALLTELELRLAAEPRLQGRRLESIWIGGGTPTLWPPEDVARVLEGVAARLPLAEGLEVTLEANPEGVVLQRMQGYRAAGVNRVSLGLQSFNGRTLKTLGRVHDAAESQHAYETVRKAGFEVVSLELVYGVPGQLVSQAEEDTRLAAALGPEHLCAFALKVEPARGGESTALARQVALSEVKLLPLADVMEMAREVREACEAAGLPQYELCSHARPGHGARHSALYWTGGEYLALGAGAQGRLITVERGRPQGGYRYTNLRSAGGYLRVVEAKKLPESGRERLSAEELFFDRISMGLRLRSGVHWERACMLYGQPMEPRRQELKELVDRGLATLEGGRLVLTPEGAARASAGVGEIGRLRW